MKLRFGIGVMVLAVVGGCGTVDRPTATPVVLPAVSAFRQHLAGRGSISFRSHFGQAIRADNDTELTFYPNGDACMLVHGMAGESFNGKYHLHDDGCVTMWFIDFRSPWPAMELEGAGTDLLMQPLDPAVQMYEESTDTRIYEDHYWHFRVLTGAAEDEVLRTIKAWHAMPATAPDRPIVTEQ